MLKHIDMYRCPACKKRYCTVSDGIKEDKAIRFAYRALVQFIGSEMPSERLSMTNIRTYRIRTASDGILWKSKQSNFHARELRNMGAQIKWVLSIYVFFTKTILCVASIMMIIMIMLTMIMAMIIV